MIGFSSLRIVHNGSENRKQRPEKTAAGPARYVPQEQLLGLPGGGTNLAAGHRHGAEHACRNAPAAPSPPGPPRPGRWQHQLPATQDDSPGDPEAGAPPEDRDAGGGARSQNGAAASGEGNGRRQAADRTQGRGRLRQRPHLQVRLSFRVSFGGFV